MSVAADRERCTFLPTLPGITDGCAVSRTRRVGTSKRSWCRCSGSYGRKRPAWPERRGGRPRWRVGPPCCGAHAKPARDIIRARAGCAIGPWHPGRMDMRTSAGLCRGPEPVWRGPLSVCPVGEDTHPGGRFARTVRVRPFDRLTVERSRAVDAPRASPLQASLFWAKAQWIRDKGAGDPDPPVEPFSLSDSMPFARSSADDVAQDAF
jgi:hypothetical protein